MKRLMVLNQFVLAASAAFLLHAQPAQAAYVQVIADPLLDQSVYPGYGWSATGALYIEDNCYNEIQRMSSDGFYQLNLAEVGATESCGNTYATDVRTSAIRLVDVSVTVYQNNNPADIFDTVPIGDYLAENELEAAYGSLTLARLLDIGFEFGQLVSFHTTLSVAVATNPPLPGDEATGTLLQLQFNKDYEEVIDARGVSGSTTATDCDVLIANCSTLYVTGASGRTSTAAPSTVAGPVLTNEEYAALGLPEPGSVSLVAAGLFGAWWARRRRPKAA